MYFQNQRCEECGSYTVHHAKNLCPTCYHRLYLRVYYLNEDNRQKYREWRLNHEIRQAEKELHNS